MARKNNIAANGRNKTTRFARIDHSMLHCDAYRSLSPTARVLLLELISMDNDSNNGSLYLSVRDAAARIGVADLAAASRAFDELQNMGFIEMMVDASFFVKAAERSRARTWRLTHRPGPGRRGPSNEFMSRTPERGSREHKRMVRGQMVIKKYKQSKSRGHFPVLDSNTK